MTHIHYFSTGLYGGGWLRRAWRAGLGRARGWPAFHSTAEACHV
jgi:hypothetical protein